LGAGRAALAAEALLWLELSGRGFGKDVFGFGFWESCGLLVGWNLKVAI
jgi:hypothetical protein